MWSPYIVLCLVASVTAVAVHNLTSSNFHSFIEGHELSLVAFIAPWCVHCQDLGPVFESTAVKAAVRNWTLAHVDCDVEKHLCRDYKIPIYPTIRVFHREQHTIYNGDRKSDAMLSLLGRHSQPLVTLLSSTDDAVEFRSKDRVTIVGYFDEDDQASKTVFSEIAKANRDEYLFGSISDDTFSEVEDVTKPSVVLYKSFDDGKSLYTGDFDKEKIQDFIDDAATPLIREIDVDLGFFPANFGGMPIAMIFAEKPEERAELVENLRSVAEATKGKIAWVTADPIKYAQRASQVALRPGKWPAFAIEDRPNDFKFAFPSRGSIEDLDPQAIQDIVDDFLAGKLESSVMSDPVPTTQEGSVIDVVADSFEEVVLNNDKDVVALFYSPTCPHCQAMAPSYSDFAKLLKPHTDLITVAQIDATSNDVWPRVTSFPTIKLYKSSFKDEPIVYEGNRTVEDFVRFVKEKGSSGLAEKLKDLPDRLASGTLHDEL